MSIVKFQLLPRNNSASSFAQSPPDGLADFSNLNSDFDSNSDATFAAAPPEPQFTAAFNTARASSTNAGAPSGGDAVPDDDIVTTNNSGLVFDNSYDTSNVSSAFFACIHAAEHMLATLFTNSFTLNLSFTSAYDDTATWALENTAEGKVTVDYSTLISRLPSSDVMPSSDPSDGGTWKIPEAYARFLGITTTTPTIDETVTLNTAEGWSYGQDVINGLIHEITENGMGRVGSLGDGKNHDYWSTMDLFRYAGSKGAGSLDDGAERDGRDGETTYFSSDGGKTFSADSFHNQYNSSGTQVDTEDVADWDQQAVFGTTGGGETLTLTQDELNVMAALGWTVNVPEDIMAGASANWETFSQWSVGCMPITVEDALVSMDDGAVATTDCNVVVNSISLDVGSTLHITGGTTFDAKFGTTPKNASDGGGNGGAIIVDVGCTLTMSGEFKNFGSLTLGSAIDGDGAVGAGILSPGVLTLDGQGLVYLGTAVDGGFTTGEIIGGSGSELINVDNTILGGGLFSQLQGIDNQAGGTIESTDANGPTLEIYDTAFSNEGNVFVDDQTTFELWVTNLNNAGSVYVGSSGVGTFSIGRAVDITGAGSVQLRGAGSRIDSDGYAATLTNESTIIGYANSQIGDFGILSGNNLTFENRGTVDAQGGVLTINTGSLVVNDTAGVLEAGLHGTLAIKSAVTTGEGASVGTPPGGTIEAAAGGKVTVAASVTVGNLTAPYVTGQAVVDAGGELDVLSGGSIAIPLQIQGASGGVAAGVVTVAPGGSISGAVAFQGGGTLNLFTTPGTVAITGSGGTANLTSAKVSISGGGDTVNFNSGSNSASLSNTASNGDTVRGSNGVVNLTSASVTVTGGADTVNFTGAGNQASLYYTSGAWDTVNGSQGVVNVELAQASIVGGGNAIHMDGASSASLYNTGGAWDTVYGSNKTVDLTSAQASVLGGGDTIYLLGAAASFLSLYSTVGAWDTVTGKGDQIILTDAQASVIGGGDTIAATGGSSVSLYSTSGYWDAVNGSDEQIYLTQAQAAITGESDTMTTQGACSLSIAGTNGHWDAIKGSGDTVTISSSQVSILGGGDTLWGNGSSSESLYQTAGKWDTVNGSGQQVILTSSQASIVGGSNTVSMTAGSSISLYGTSTKADAVTGSSDSLVLSGAEASLKGDQDTVAFTGKDTLVVTGSHEAFDFGAALGLTSIGGFNTTDVLHLSKSDWTSFAALHASGDLKQSGANALISLNASNTITLASVQASSLTTANFAFA